MKYTEPRIAEAFEDIWNKYKFLAGKEYCQVKGLLSDTEDQIRDAMGTKFFTEFLYNDLKEAGFNKNERSFLTQEFYHNDFVQNAFKDFEETSYAFEQLSLKFMAYGLTKFGDCTTYDGLKKTLSELEPDKPFSELELHIIAGYQKHPNLSTLALLDKEIGQKEQEWNRE